LFLSSSIVVNHHRLVALVAQAGYYYSIEKKSLGRDSNP
jgi:hypothetical protein